MKQNIRFSLNNELKEISIDPERTLLWVLRNDFSLTGTKYGCGMGHCGSCTVLIDDMSVRACMVTADFVKDKSVVTIEGLGTPDNMHPVQQAFVNHDALQCGYCTPGMIMSATGLLIENKDPSRDEIVDAMEENLCRCGAHPRIIDAIAVDWREMKEGI